MASDDLRPCPLCNEPGLPEQLRPHDGGYVIRCSGCGLQTSEGGHFSDAIAEWNRLAMLPHLEAVVRDMLSGLVYLRDADNVPYGFGLKRLEDTGKAALAEAPEGK